MEQKLAEKSVKWILERDAFSAWLGIELIEIKPGSATLRMIVRKEMLNGLSMAHGGIAYSLADSAAGYASNSYGKIAVAVDNSMTYPVPVHEGDVLTAHAQELSTTNKLGIYDVTIAKGDGTKVALFRGMVYRTQKDLFW